MVSVTVRMTDLNIISRSTHVQFDRTLYNTLVLCAVLHGMSGIALSHCCFPSDHVPEEPPAEGYERGRGERSALPG